MPVSSNVASISSDNVEDNIAQALIQGLNILMMGQSLEVQKTNAAIQRNAWEAVFADNGINDMTYLNVAEGGSYISDTSGAIDSETWWRLAADEPAGALIAAKAAADAAGFTPNVGTFKIGESEVNALPVTSTKAQVKAAWLAIMDDVQANYGPMNFYIHMMGMMNPGPNGENGGAPAEGNWQIMREIGWEMIAERSNIRFGVEDWDKRRQDRLHIEEGDERADISQRSGLPILAQEKGININWIGPQISHVEVSGSNRILATCQLQPGTSWHANMNHFTSNKQCAFDELAGQRSIVQVFKNDVRLPPNSIRHYNEEGAGFANKFRIDFPSGTFSASDQIDFYVAYDWCGVDNGDGTYDLLQTQRNTQSNLIKDTDNLPLRSCHWHSPAGDPLFNRLSPLVA